MMEAAILYGNGVNKFDPNCPSWRDFLFEIIQEKKDLAVINSNTMLFESIVMLSNQNKQKYPQLVSSLKKKVIEIFNKKFQSPILEAIASLPVDNFITTNYDNSIINYFEGEFKKFNFGESYYNITRYRSNGRIKIWKIHGDIEHIDSIVLGFEQYGRSVMRIGEYVTGKYKQNHKSYKKPPILQKVNCGFPRESFSWIDLFFTHDIHIVGLGLSQDEQDLWWLLMYRMSVIVGHKKCHNKIFYYTTKDIDVSEERVFQTLGITIQHRRNHNISYEQEYLDIIEEMKKVIKYRKKATSLIKK